MSKFGSMRQEADTKWSDPNESAVAARGIDLLEDWTQLSGCDDCSRLKVFSRWKRRRECSKFITDGLHRARAEEHGFLGTLLTAVAFQLLVKVIVNWIMSKFFE